MEPFSLLIKPVSADCNLGCRYCYYRSAGAGARKRGRHPQRMTPDILEAVIRAYLQTDQPIYSMIWHGGEPTLLPGGFYKNAIAFQKKHARKGSRIANSIQTNGVGISEPLARLMGRYRFVCGVSLDGPATVHDIYRRTKQGRPTHRNVIEGIRTLAGAGVPVSILVVVSQANVHAPLEVYRYLKACGFDRIQCIPCVETDAGGRLCEYAIDGEQWGRFLISIFKAWFEKDIHRISIRLFESILARQVYGAAIDCYNSGACNRYLVVESNGDVYPCDFFVRPEYRLGNILERPFAEIVADSRYRRFSAAKKNWHPTCSQCEYIELCMGDCPKFRPGAATASPSRSRLCTGWQLFFSATIDRFRCLADAIRKQAAGK